MTVEEIKKSVIGEWVSIAPEIRPSAAKNADGSLKPFYLTRAFEYFPGDTMENQHCNGFRPCHPLLKMV